jgi:hypothetical protein
VWSGKARESVRLDCGISVHDGHQQRTIVAHGSETFDVPALYVYLVSIYSANTGARKAALTQEIWETKNPVGQDPAAVFGQVRLAHGQLYATQTKPDQMLGYALLNTLDESYADVKQTLWSNNDLTSAIVLAQVQAEFNRRSAQTTSTALLAQGPG